MLEELILKVHAGGVKQIARNYFLILLKLLRNAI